MANSSSPIAFIPNGLLAPTALRQPAPQPPPTQPAEVAVSIDAEAPNKVRTDPSGAIEIETDDGSVIIDLNPQQEGLFGPRTDVQDFNANLAEHIDAGEQGRIADELLRGIMFDEQSRQEWLDTRAQGIRILGLKIEQPRSSVESGSAVDGMSNIRHPMLLESTLRFQANARGELLPADGPVKAVDKLTMTATTDELAEKLEDGLNYYLTTVATEYYPDTDRMLFYVGFGGCGFKKVYNCPLRQRPVSESVDAKDLIVSNAATDMHNSGRVTHQIRMRQSVLKRMQLAGAYRNVPITTPPGVTLNAVDRQIAETQGIDPNTQQQQEDRDHTIYECYCELDIRGFEHKEDGVPTGLPLPYRVVIEKDSRQILEIRRNWREDDETLAAKICFVKYPYVPGLGFYDIGLIHILGNTSNSLTAAWRELLDAGMFANFPGFLYSKLLGRQNSNEFRVPPGGGAPIDTNGMKIGDAVMPLPYKDISTAFASFIEHISETGQRVGGTAEIQIGEGKQDAPVGTTLALIEQATKVESAVHKRLHAAQAEEFGLLKECFRENPRAFIKAMQARGETDWDEEGFIAALDNASIVPVADPNTPSHIHRLMKAIGLVQLDKQYPGVMDAPKVAKRVAAMMRIDDFDSLLAPPNPHATMPPELQIEMAKLQDAQASRQAKVDADNRKMMQLQFQREMQREAHAHEDRMQMRESGDQAAERQQELQSSLLDFQASRYDNQAQLQTEAMKLRAAEIDAGADMRKADASVKVAEHGVSVAKHTAEATKHSIAHEGAKAKTEAAKAKTVEAKAKAAATKPGPKS
jgi:hypothetical protein